MTKQSTLFLGIIAFLLYSSALRGATPIEKKILFGIPLSNI